MLKVNAVYQGSQRLYTKMTSKDI